MANQTTLDKINNMLDMVKKQGAYFAPAQDRLVYLWNTSTTDTQTAYIEPFTAERINELFDFLPSLK